MVVASGFFGFGVNSGLLCFRINSGFFDVVVTSAGFLEGTAGVLGVVPVGEPLIGGFLLATSGFFVAIGGFGVVPVGLGVVPVGLGVVPEAAALCAARACKENNVFEIMFLLEIY